MKPIILSMVLAAAVCGCRSDRIYVIDGNSPTNAVPAGAFQDETYIWEDWSFGTNQVRKLEK